MSDGNYITIKYKNNLIVTSLSFHSPLYAACDTFNACQMEIWHVKGMILIEWIICWAYYIFEIDFQHIFFYQLLSAIQAERMKTSLIAMSLLLNEFVIDSPDRGRYIAQWGEGSRRSFQWFTEWYFTFVFNQNSCITFNNLFPFSFIFSAHLITIMENIFTIRHIIWLKKFPG